MPNDETLAALERAAARVEKEARAAKSSWLYKAGQPASQDNGQSVYWKGRFDALQADATLIRALIERERAGGERAQIVAYLHECRLIHEANATRKGQVTARRHHIDACTHIADAIKAGAHGKESGVPLK